MLDTHGLSPQLDGHGLSWCRSLRTGRDPALRACGRIGSSHRTALLLKQILQLTQSYFSAVRSGSGTADSSVQPSAGDAGPYRCPCRRPYRSSTCHSTLRRVRNNLTVPSSAQLQLVEDNHHGFYVSSTLSGHSRRSCEQNVVRCTRSHNMFIRARECSSDFRWVATEVEGFRHEQRTFPASPPLWTVAAHSGAQPS